MSEIWKDIRNFEGIYQVSNLGKVRSLDRITQRSDGTVQKSKGQILKPGSNGRGYMQVNLYKASKVFHEAVAYLVLEAFVSKRPVGMEACHNDGNNSNDTLENLRWDTHSNNQLDQIKHGTHFNTNKTHCKYNHKLGGSNTRYKSDGTTQCRACSCAHAYFQRRSTTETFDVVANRYYERIMSEQ